MNDIFQLNEHLQDYLTSSSVQIIADLKNVLTYKILEFDKGYAKEDIFEFCFEYEPEYLNLVGWAFNKNGKMIIKSLPLPTKIDGDEAKAKSLNRSFLPKSIRDGIGDFEEEYYEEEDASEEKFKNIMEKYAEAKYEIFEKWFCSCWEKAIDESATTVPAYFSKHNVDLKTDLNTLQKVNKRIGG